MLNKNDVKLGIAPIAWTNDDMPDLGKDNTFEQCISEMALAGFEGSEIGNKYPKDTEILKHYLDVRGLKICNGWFSTFFSVNAYDKTIRDFIKHRDRLHTLGAKVIGASEQGNSIQGKNISVFGENKPIFDKEQWKLVIKGYNQLGELAQEKDMLLTYHHHMGTGIQTEEETDRFLESVNPEKVFLLFDSGHFAFAGIDPTQVIKKYIKKIKHVHLKDIRMKVVEEVKKNNWSFLDAVRKGVFTVPGDGDLDFSPIFKTLAESKYCGWMVVEAEQDPSKANPFEYALKARRYIEKLTGL